MFLNFLAVLLVSLILALVAAHSQPGLKYITNEKRSGKIIESYSSCWPFQSFHIHVMFWPSNTNSTSAAEQLQVLFMKQFQLTYESNTCPFPNSDIAPDFVEICIFKTQNEPAGMHAHVKQILYLICLTLGHTGPFLTGQSPYFIPISYYEKTVSFMVQNRGQLDIFVHPNTGSLLLYVIMIFILATLLINVFCLGCGVHDHLQASFWAGNKWELDISIFFE